MENAQMADPTAGNSPAPVQPTSGQAASLPPGHRAVSESDFGRFQRYEQQVRGFEPYGQRFAKYGIKTPEDLDRYFASQQSQGEGQGQQQAATSAAGQSFDPAMVDKAVAAAIARERHTESRKGEGSLIKSWAKKLAGEDADEFAVEDAEDYLRSRLAALREDGSFEANFYPDGHPLRDEALAPFGDAHFEKVKSSWGERLTKREAARMQQVGQAANRTVKPKPQPAGSSGGQGKPENNAKGRRPSELIDDIVSSALAGRG